MDLLPKIPVSSGGGLPPGKQLNTKTDTNADTKTNTNAIKYGEIFFVIWKFSSNFVFSNHIERPSK